MPPKIAVRNLAKRYGAVVGVRDVSFTVQPGEIFGLLGPNGAGKTTTLECLAGLREPDTGELTVCGLDLRTQPHAAKEKLGAVLQSTALPDQLTPREALRLFGSFFRERVPPDVLLERFALQEKADARFATLSGGQRQRRALALAFVNRPEVVLLDEPTTGLDPQARREVQAEILRMKTDGHTVLLSTHDLAEAERLCDRVAIIDRGEIIALGSPRELIAQSGLRQSVMLVSSPPIAPARLASVPGVEEQNTEGDVLRFQTRQAATTVAAIMALLAADGVALVALEVSQPSLEDWFIQFTKSRGADERTLRS